MLKYSIINERKRNIGQIYLKVTVKNTKHIIETTYPNQRYSIHNRVAIATLKHWIKIKIY